MMDRTVYPTFYLRFVEREIDSQKIKVLQQWWQPKEWNECVGNGVPGNIHGEWRDVSLEKENNG